MIPACIIGAVLIVASLVGPQIIAAVRKSATSREAIPTDPPKQAFRADVPVAILTPARTDNETRATKLREMLDARDVLENCGMSRDEILENLKTMASKLVVRDATATPAKEAA